ncbi:hypothetical protein D3C77_490910 [compost metagenome]
MEIGTESSLFAVRQFFGIIPEIIPGPVITRQIQTRLLQMVLVDGNIPEACIGHRTVILSFIRRVAIKFLLRIDVVRLIEFIQRIQHAVARALQHVSFVIHQNHVDLFTRRRQNIQLLQHFPRIIVLHKSNVLDFNFLALGVEGIYQIHDWLAWIPFGIAVQFQRYVLSSGRSIRRSTSAVVGNVSISGFALAAIAAASG